MKKKSYKRKKGPVQSKKISYDGINFASGLERYMYMALKKAKIKSLYEGETFELQEAFDFPFESYERCGNGKGEYKNRGKKKILNIKYTPDFIGEGFVVALTAGAKITGNTTTAAKVTCKIVGTEES